MAKRADKREQRGKAEKARAAGIGESRERETRKTAAASKKKIYAAAFIIILAIIIAGGLAYGLAGSSGSTSFLTFQNNFNSAQRVGILVMAQNGTELSPAIGCSTKVIEQVVGSRQRNSSTIDYYTLNATSCDYLQGLGVQSQVVTTTPANCLSTSSAEPRIVINYSSVNSTVIKPTSLYVSGDAAFLTECGVATEITSR